MMENLTPNYLIAYASAGIVASSLLYIVFQDRNKGEKSDDNLSGILQVFSTEIFNPLITTNNLALRKYTLPTGIPNLGNTCYMNAVLQALTGCIPFISYLDKI